MITITENVDTKVSAILKDENEGIKSRFVKSI